ncbi:MAG: hypothetical protein R3F59_24175 [Myxococcota bacterium]
MSVAMFAALVAAVTVVAAMTVVGALALLYYGAGQEEDHADELTQLNVPGSRTYEGQVASSLGEMLPTDVHAVMAEATLEQSGLYPADSVTHIHTPRIAPMPPPVEDQESSLNRDLAPFRPAASGWASRYSAASAPAAPRGAPSRFARAVPGDAAYGTPEWTEEEGATEIFSAHNFGDLSEFAFVDEEVPASRR